MRNDGGTYDWSVVVFAANEAKTIASCVQSVQANAAGRPMHLTVMLNGSRDATLDVIRQLPPGPADLSVYAIEAADKANAINQFIYNVRPRSQFYIFLDAYVTLSPSAIEAAVGALIADPKAHVASGYPLNGRSAKWFRETLQAGAINGNFYCMRSEFLDRLVAEQIKLPLRIYRGDPLFGSIAAHDFDSLANPWDTSCMLAPDGATYSIRPLSPLNWGDVKRQYRREINQARGLVESAAVKSIIYEAGYAALPADANQMLNDWLARHRCRPPSWKSRAFLPLALRKLRAAGPLPAPEKLATRLAYERRASAPHYVK